ncbi:hypothetical protein Tco_1170223 [Tanacetum coccineum]
MSDSCDLIPPISNNDRVCLLVGFCERRCREVERLDLGGLLEEGEIRDDSVFGDCEVMLPTDDKEDVYVEYLHLKERLLILRRIYNPG